MVVCYLVEIIFRFLSCRKFDGAWRQSHRTRVLHKFIIRGTIGHGPSSTSCHSTSTCIIFCSMVWCRCCRLLPMVADVREYCPVPSWSINVILNVLNFSVCVPPHSQSFAMQSIHFHSAVFVVVVHVIVLYDVVIIVADALGFIKEKWGTESNKF